MLQITIHREPFDNCLLIAFKNKETCMLLPLNNPEREEPFEGGTIGKMEIEEIIYFLRKTLQGEEECQNISQQSDILRSVMA